MSLQLQRRPASVGGRPPRDVRGGGGWNWQPPSCGSSTAPPVVNSNPLQLSSARFEEPSVRTASATPAARSACCCGMPSSISLKDDFLEAVHLELLAGMSLLRQELSRAVGEAIAEAVHDAVVKLQSEVQSGVAEVKTGVAEVKTGVAEIKTDIKSGIAVLHQSLDTDFAQVCAELSKVRENLHGAELLDSMSKHSKQLSLSEQEHSKQLSHLEQELCQCKSTIMQESTFADLLSAGLSQIKFEPVLEEFHKVASQNDLLQVIALLQEVTDHLCQKDKKTEVDLAAILGVKAPAVDFPTILRGICEIQSLVLRSKDPEVDAPVLLKGVCEIQSLVLFAMRANKIEERTQNLQDCVTAALGPLHSYQSREAAMFADADHGALPLLNGDSQQETSGVDANGDTLRILCVESPASRVPLGVVVADQGSQVVLQKAIEKSLVDKCGQTARSI